MAEAPDTTTTLANFFKQKFSNFMGRDLAKASDFAMSIESEGVEETCGGTGLDVKFANKYADGVGSAALDEGSTFPESRVSKAFQYTLGLAHMAFTVRFTGHAEAMGSSTEMGWIKGVLKEKSDEIRSSAKRTWARWLLHTGNSYLGQITAIEASGANKYITVDGAPIHYYEPQQILTIRDLSTGGSEQLTGSGDGTVVDVDYVNGRVVLAHTQGAAVGDYVAWTGYYDKTVPNGLQKIVAATGTIQGVTRTSVGYYSSQAVVISNGSAPMEWDTPDVLRDTVQNIAASRGSYRAKWVFNREMRQEAANATVGQNRFSNLNLKMGVTSMKVEDQNGEKEFIEEENLPFGSMWAVCLSEFVRAYPEGMKGGYAKRVGGEIILPVYNSSGAMIDASQMIWIIRGNIGCRNFRCQGVTNNIVAA